MRKYILILFVSVFIISCSDYKYPQNIEISERDGALVDSSTSYLPEELVFDGTTHIMEWNKETLEQLNNYYRTTSEPLLYNYYLGRDIYRIVIVEEGKEPLILSVNKDNHKAWVVSKRVEIQEPLSADSLLVSSLLTPSFDHFTKDLTDEEWTQFVTLWKAANFYTQTNNKAGKSFDNFCVIEAHEKNKYWYVFRSLDDSSMKELYTYVRSLTRF